MAATTAIPGLGHFSKKEMYVLGGGAVVVVGIALYRSHEKATAAAAAAAASTTNTGADTTIDPTTGLPAGSPEDTAELEQESEYANDTNYGYSSGGYTDPYSSTTGYTSNSQWSQAAQEYLTNYDGGDAATIGAALGAYLTGSYVTPAQVTIIEQAIAFEGAAPQPGTNGYPPSLNTTPPSTTTGTGGTTGTKTIAQAAGTVVNIPSNIKSFGTLAKMASHFGESVAHLQQANPGLSPTATTGTINIPFLIKPGMTLASIAATFEESQEHIASVLATQGIV